MRDRGKSKDQRAITVERVRDISNPRCESIGVRIRGQYQLRESEIKAIPGVRDRDKSEDQRTITVERVKDKSNPRCER